MKNPWNLIAKKYDEQFGDTGDFSHRYIIYPALAEILGDVANKKILDLGCGTGTLSRILAKENAEVTGIDNAKEMLKIAKGKKKNGRTISYIISDIRQKISFEDETFDIALQIMILHSIEDKHIQNILTETCRVLKTKGECLIVIPHPYFIKELRSIGYPAGELYLSNYKTYFVWKQFNEICNSPTEFYLRPLEYYAQICEKAGFVIKNIYEPKIVNSLNAKAEKPHIFNRRKEIPGFIVLKLVKLDI